MRKISFYLRLLVFLSLITRAQHTTAQLSGRTEGQPFVTNFTPIEYNGESQNWDIIQDQDNVLYIANTGGFLTFDGVEWRKFQASNTGLALCFAMDDQGKIFTGGTGLIGVLDFNNQGEIVYQSLLDFLPKNFSLNFVRACIYFDGKVYFQNPTHVMIWDGSTFEVIKCPEKISTIILYKEEIMVCTYDGLYVLQNSSLKKFAEDNIPGNIRNMIVVDNNRTLICTFDKGVFAYNGNKIVPMAHASNEFLKEKMIQHATLLPDGNIAFATKTGGVLITDQTLQPIWRLNQQTGLQDDDIKKVMIDHEGNLWTANNRGISKTEYPISTTYFDLNKNNLGTIEEIKTFENELYLGTFMGTYRMKPVHSEMLLTDQCLPTFEQIPGSTIENFVLGEINHQLLFGGQGGLKIMDGNISRVISTHDPRKLLVSDLHPQVIYVGHTDGASIMFFDQDKIVREIVLDLPDHEFRGIAETDDGDLWLTTIINGVYFVDLDDQLNIKSVTEYDMADGLPSLRDNLVYKVDHQIYFTTHQGIYTFDSLKQQFQPNPTFGEVYADQSRFVYAFDSDGDKNVWLNAFNKRETGHAMKLADGSYHLDYTSFNTMNHMQVYDILAQSDGVTWFGGSDGLVRYQASNYSTPKPVFNTKIRKVTIGLDSVIYWGSGISVAPTLDAPFRDIRFDVAGITFQNPEMVEYQFQLLGNNNEWSTWHKEPFAIYTNLSKGSYTFNVRAKNAKGQISNADNFSFFILPYWYETWWFRMALIILSCVLIYLIINYLSQRKIVKKVEELEMIQRIEKAKDEEIIKEKEFGIAAMIKAQESERQRIAKDLHDGIVQEIGSNVIRWRNLFGSDQPDKLVAQQLIDSLENSNKELRALSHQMMPKALSALGIIAALEGLLEGSLPPAQVRYEFEHFGIHDRLAENIEITLYRVSQELIQNIIKHSQATMVNVQLYQTGQDIHLIVEDNGVGMDSTRLENGIGLHNIKSRLDTLHGAVNFEASPQNGTLVTIKIPLGLNG